MTHHQTFNVPVHSSATISLHLDISQQLRFHFITMTFRVLAQKEDDKNGENGRKWGKENWPTVPGHFFKTVLGYLPQWSSSIAPQPNGKFSCRPSDLGPFGGSLKKFVALHAHFLALVLHSMKTEQAVTHYNNMKSSRRSSPLPWD